MLRRMWPNHDCPSGHTLRNINIHARMISVALRLKVSGCCTIGDNLHTLLSLIRCRQRAFITRLLIVVQNDYFSESVLDFFALFTSLISPLLELRKRDVLDLLPSFHPRPGLEDFVVVRVHVTDVGDDSKLHSTSQRQLLRVTHAIGSLEVVSITPRSRHH